MWKVKRLLSIAVATALLVANASDCLAGTGVRVIGVGGVEACDLDFASSTLNWLLRPGTSATLFVGPFNFQGVESTFARAGERKLVEFIRTFFTTFPPTGFSSPQAAIMDSTLYSRATSLFTAMPQPLSFCLGGRGCQLRIPSIRMLEVEGPNPYFRFSPETPGDQEGGQALIDLEIAPTNSLIFSFLPSSLQSFTMGPRELAGWWSTIFQETTHFLDMRLLQFWVRANQKIIRDGGSPDRLFRQHAVVTPDGGVVLDAGFTRVFLESRGYAAEAEFRTLVAMALAGVYPPFNEEGPFKGVMTANLRQLTLSALNGLSGFQSARDFLDANPQIVRALFAFGLSSAQTMRDTIVRSGLPLSE